MQQKLNDLHLLVQSGGVCVMVEGCGGCGKSALLRAYASACGYRSGENLVVIHLGEQIDGKVYWWDLMYGSAILIDTEYDVFWFLVLLLAFIELHHSIVSGLLLFRLDGIGFQSPVLI